MLADYEIFPKVVLGDELFRRFNKFDSAFFARSPYSLTVTALHDLFFLRSEHNNQSIQKPFEKAIIIDNVKYENRRAEFLETVTDEQYMEAFQRLAFDLTKVSKPMTWKELAQKVPNVGIPTVKILCHVLFWLNIQFTHQPATAATALCTFTWVSKLRDGPFAEKREKELIKWDNSPYDAAVAFVYAVFEHVEENQAAWNEKSLHDYVS